MIVQKILDPKIEVYTLKRQLFFLFMQIYVSKAITYIFNQIKLKINLKFVNFR